MIPLSAFSVAKSRRWLRLISVNTVSALRPLHATLGTILAPLLLAAGTHGTGFAYSIDGGRTLKLHHSYPDQPRAYPKTLTAVLYKNRCVGASVLPPRDDKRRSSAPSQTTLVVPPHY